ncbi:hypothetical protein J32TS6_40540 [Virgibacillus pantothenticus]|uniref:DUF1648 domain-containing protein n=1 Tax=Virgibacillus pantothenticus TaxID=1473 RepID=A0A0L0QSY1_VIRPA|nr:MULTISPECIES: hypothetical protein [Virgibacillus]API91719.1 hypothetical protein BKP57_07685 [Virgibacillus sp. 6R]KNE21637.1 hypothetical protein AFK71_08345 [Virgibacillus pantothenticus]MBS7427836.1 hypothetical protein [Virgibacillus sp. 19R1-5]MBU8568637.1 hypothetical protein [Virgibacillus pantothenticus]MBU8602619.1 hypothetical protein [Virgibacillus pantothenticus]
MEAQHNLTKWYTATLSLTIILPIMYIIYLVLIVQTSGKGFQAFFNEDPVFTILLMISLINPFWGHLLNSIPKEHRFKKGKADKLLNYMLASQVVVGNILMAIIVFMTKRKLQSVGTADSLNTFEKIAAIFLLVFTIFCGGILLRLTIVSL